MTDDKHTPEPWLVDRFGDICGGPDEEWIIGATDTAPDTTLADARRIVACVNACAGIPTEALEDPATVIAGKVEVVCACAGAPMTNGQCSKCGLWG